MKLERKANNIIQWCLSNSMLLNVSGEAATKVLWNKFRTLYESKSINKIFLLKKLYLLRMNDKDSITQHLNGFNAMVIRLFYVNIKFFDEDKCISLLCSLLDLWDSLYPFGVI
jgi:hypothetical protein